MKTLQIMIIVFLSILFVGLSIAQQSTTPTVTFNVPVQLASLHQTVQAVKVRCIVCDNPGGSHFVAEGETEIPCPASGNINQTVTVVTTQISGQDITKGINYGAILFLKINGAWQSPSQTSSTPVEYRAKEGTPFTGQVRAELHW